MYKIGDFSRLSRVSVKTLRYYDEVGLLKPVKVDRFSGYRFYQVEQLPRLYHILALRDLDFSIEQIGHLLDANPDGEAGQRRMLIAMLEQKRSEIEQRLSADQERLRRLDARLKQIEQEDQMSTYDVVIKKIAPLQVASVRDIIPSYPEQGHLWSELYHGIEAKGVQFNEPCLTVYHSDEPEIDAEVCQLLSGPVQAHGRVQVHELPAVDSMAATTHHGAFVTIGQAYDALLKWIEASGYRITGACREIYLKPPAQAGSQTDPETITEIQFPVARV